MTREEREKAINKIMGYLATYLSVDQYAEAERIIKELRQDTVSRESYEHEYFLRKELDFKIAKLEKAIEALEQENVLFKSGLLKDCESCRAEQEPCEDTISRQAMLEYQHCLYGKMSNKENHKLWKFITELPSVTPAHKKCCNINTDYAECDQFICSNCGIELQDWSRVERDEDDGDITYHEYEFNFCPNCGARKEDEA